MGSEPIRIDGKEFFIEKIILSDSSGIVAVVRPKEPLEGGIVLMISIPPQPELTKEELKSLIKNGIRERD